MTDEVLNTDDPTRGANLTAEAYWDEYELTRLRNEDVGIPPCGVPADVVAAVEADLDGDGLPG